MRRPNFFEKSLWTFTTVMLGASLLVGCSGRGDGDRAPWPEVVLYTSVDEQISAPIIKLFEQRTGVRVRTLGDTEATKTTGLISRLRQEHAQGDARADVFWSSEIFQTIQLAREGVLESIESAELDDWPARWRDPDRRWFGFALRARVIVYNTNHAPIVEAPRRMSDLLDPRYKNRIVMARPAFGTTRGHLAALLHLWGPAAYRDWLVGLKNNGVRLVDGNSAVVQAVATGQAWVGLTDTDDVYAGVRNNWPVAMNIAQHAASLDDSGSTQQAPTSIMAIPNTVGLVAQGPNRDAALLLIHFLLSQDVEQILAAGESHNTPVRAPIEKAQAEYMLPIDRGGALTDYAAIAGEMDRALAIAREALGG